MDQSRAYRLLLDINRTHLVNDQPITLTDKDLTISLPATFPIQAQRMGQSDNVPDFFEIKQNLKADSLRHYREGTEILEDIEKGLFGLRALLQITLQVCKLGRHKVLMIPMARFTEAIDQVREETFKKKRFDMYGSEIDELTMREHRLKTQHQIIFDAIRETSRILNADEVIETTVRGTAKHGHFEDVEKMIIQDKHTRHK